MLGIAASFILARASLSVAADLGEAERWLIYPSLIIVYVPVTVVLLIWPLPAAIIAEVLLVDPGGPRELVAWTRQYPLGTITAFTLATLGVSLVGLSRLRRLALARGRTRLLCPVRRQISSASVLSRIGARDEAYS